jgi:hypothetical protein
MNSVYENIIRWDARMHNLNLKKMPLKRGEKKRNIQKY